MKNQNENANNRTYEERINRIVEILQLGETRVCGDSIQMCCPFHKEENASFGINMNTGAYHCFACGAKGHISKLVENLMCNILAEKVDNIEEFEVTTKIDTVSYSAKPQGAEIGSIRNRLVNVPMSKYTLKELLGLITTGHTVSLSGAKTNNEWAGQQVVMVDLDNEYSGVSMNDVIAYAKSIGLEPTFAYHTYKSTENCCRCRLVYVFKETITDKQRYLAIANHLIKQFQEYSADPACADLCRLFFGTMNTDVYKSNILYSTRFTSEQLGEVAKVMGKGKSLKRSSATSDISDVSCSSEDTDVSDSEFFNGRVFLHHIFGQYMIEHYHIIRLNGNQLHIYKNGVYENNDDTHDIETEMSTIIPKLSNKDIDEAIGYIKRVSKREVESDYRFIAFNNGILNIVTMNFMAFTPNIIVTSRVNIDYLPYDNSVFNSIVDKFFGDITCHNKEQEQLLYEIIGYCSCRTNMFHLAFILKGNGGNGKSTYFKIIKELLGDSAASIRLRKVTTDKFASTSLYGKTVAIADDINNGRDVDTGLLKTIISGDGIRAEYKFENEFEFEPVATILIGMNNIVTFSDTSDGFARRFKVIPFNYKFVEGQNRDNNMKKILCSPENLQYICSKAMYYFSKVIERDSFTTPQDVESETRSYLLENRIVEQFLEENPIGREETKEVYSEFKAWAKENDYTVYTQNKLGRELTRLGFKKERGTTGKRPYYYVAPDYKENDVDVRLEQIAEFSSSDISDLDFDCNYDLSDIEEHED